MKSGIPILVITWLFLSLTSLQAQNPISRQVDESPVQLKLADGYFTLLDRSETFRQTVKRSVSFTLDEDLRRQVAENEGLLLRIPTPDGDLNLKLIPNQLFAEDYTVATSSGETFISHNRHFKGYIENQPNSVAAVSLTDEGMTAVVSTPSGGNLIIDKLKGTDEHISYFHRDMLIENPYECGVPDSEMPDFSEEVLRWENERPRPSDHCVRLHIECDNELYASQGSVAATVAFTEAVVNASSILYAMNEMYTVLSYVHVWNTADPFDDTNSSTGLSSIRSYFLSNPMFGDLGHLLSGSNNNNGGRAYINVLCSSSNNVAYSNIDPDYSNFPTYNWTVSVFAHEMGHNFGSYHTHACFWNGNFTQIDDCGNVWADLNGSTPEGNSCYNSGAPIYPASGGFIMSYCHLFSDIGINFSLGFGEESGGYMFSRYAAASCLSSCAVEECYAQELFRQVGADNQTASVGWLTVGSPDSFLVEYQLGAGPVESVTAYGNPVLLTDLQPGSTYNVTVYAYCSGGLSDGLTGTVKTLCSAAVAVPYTESFDNAPWNDSPESIDPCWVMTTGFSGYRWQPRSGGTPSGSTGPSADHTSGSGQYLYTESSVPTESFDVAYAHSPLIDLTDVQAVRAPQLQFWYSMYGAEMGNLSVAVHTADTTVTVASFYGQQTTSGATWLQETVDLSAFRGEQISIRFEGEKGNTYRSDISIDDVSVTDAGGPVCDANIVVGSCFAADTGTVVTMLTGSGGCDSIVTVQTVLLPSYDIAILDSSENPLDTGTVVYSLQTLAGCDSTVTVTTSLITNTAATQQIDLTAGWNLISSYLLPDNPDIGAMISAISGDIVIIKDALGNIAIPLLDLNLIGDWQAEEAYQFKMLNPASLSVTGNIIDPAATGIPLSENWNMLAYWNTTPSNIATALASIVADIILVKDSAGNLYAPGIGINTIGDMLPGQGYQIKMAAPAILFYPPNE